MKMSWLRIIAITAVLVVGGHGSAFAKEWYEKSCTNSGKDKDGNWYVGGPYNKSHLHIGPNFLSIFSTNNKSKPETSGKVNCAVLNQAIQDVPDGDYKTPADVTTCLIAACQTSCTWNATTSTCQ